MGFGVTPVLTPDPQSFESWSQSLPRILPTENPRSPVRASHFSCTPLGEEDPRKTTLFRSMVRFPGGATPVSRPKGPFAGRCLGLSAHPSFPGRREASRGGKACGDPMQMPRPRRPALNSRLLGNEGQSVCRTLVPACAGRNGGWFHGRWFGCCRVRHSRAGGNPVTFASSLGSRLRGKDG